MIEYGRDASDIGQSLVARCREIATDAEFQALEGIWDEVVANDGTATPFTSWDWNWEWWREFGAPSTEARSSRLLILNVTDAQGQTIAIAPFYKDRSRAVLLPRTLLPLGKWGIPDDPNAETMTEETTVAIRHGREQEALSSIFTHLMHTRSRSQWERFILSFAKPDGATFDIDSTIPNLDRTTFAGPQVLDLQDSWDACYKSLSENMRYNLRRFPNRLRKAERPWRVHVVTSPKDMPDAVETLIRLHRIRASSDRGRSHVDHIPTNRHEQFLKNILIRLARKRLAEIYLFEGNGKIVAAQAFLQKANTRTVYYSGFDPDWYDFGPITIILTEAIKHAVDRRTTVFDFMPVRSEYKNRWGVRDAWAIHDVSCFADHPRAVACRMARSGYRRIRPFKNDLAITSKSDQDAE